ncbi:ABC transporter permease [Crossiella sp. CA198]|uniref:ABC transporter permease n=1 Tax=Crossiella sp. CA198 TaxID=3455607 RepID=UPI003F8D36DC
MSTITLSWTGILRSELVKLRSVHTTVLGFAATAVLIVAYGLVNCLVLLNPAVSENNPGLDPVAQSLTGPVLGQLLVCTLGVLAVTSEYATGAIRGTLAAVPRRLPVLWAKAAALALTTFLVGLFALLVSFYAGQAVLAGGGLPTAALTDPGVPRAILGSALYLAGVAVLGVAAGILFRATTAAAATLYATLLIADSLLGLAPAPVCRAVAPFLPSNAGFLSMGGITPPEGFLSVTGGAAVFLGYLVLAVGGAALVLRSRDV